MEVRLKVYDVFRLCLLVSQDACTMPYLHILPNLMSSGTHITTYIATCWAIHQCANSINTIMHCIRIDTTHLHTTFAALLSQAKICTKLYVQWALKASTLEPRACRPSSRLRRRATRLLGSDSYRRPDDIKAIVNSVAVSVWVSLSDTGRNSLYNTCVTAYTERPHSILFACACPCQS